MYVATMELDLLLGDVHSLKEKRSIVRPIVSELRRRFDVAAAEAGHVRLPRRALAGPVEPPPRGGGGVGVVAADGRHCGDVLDECERFVAGRPEIELLSARR